jgi:hypothetical protein
MLELGVIEPVDEPIEWYFADHGVTGELKQTTTAKTARMSPNAL